MRHRALTERCALLVALRLRQRRHPRHQHCRTPRPIRRRPLQRCPVLCGCTGELAPRRELIPCELQRARIPRGELPFPPELHRSRPFVQEPRKLRGRSGAQPAPAHCSRHRIDHVKCRPHRDRILLQKRRVLRPLRIHRQKHEPLGRMRQVRIPQHELLHRQTRMTPRRPQIDDQRFAFALGRCKRGFRVIAKPVDPVPQLGARRPCRGGAARRSRSRRVAARGASRTPRRGEHQRDRRASPSTSHHVARQPSRWGAPRNGRAIRRARRKVPHSFQFRNSSRASPALERVVGPGVLLSPRRQGAPRAAKIFWLVCHQGSRISSSSRQVMRKARFAKSPEPLAPTLSEHTPCEHAASHPVTSTKPQASRRSQSLVTQKTLARLGAPWRLGDKSAPGRSSRYSSGEARLLSRDGSGYVALRRVVRSARPFPRALRSFPKFHDDRPALLRRGQDVRGAAAVELDSKALRRHSGGIAE